MCGSHHADYGLQQLVTRHIHPGHLYGCRVARGTRSQEVVYHHLAVASGWAANLQSNKTKSTTMQNVKSYIIN